MNLNENNRLLISVILCVAVLALWQHFFVKPKEAEFNKKMQEYQQTTKKISTTKEQIVESKKETIDNLKEERNKTPKITIKSDKLEGSLALKGLRFDDLTLLKYKETIEKNSKHVTLLSPNYSDQVYFAEFGWISNDKKLELPSENTLWQTKDKILSPNKPITLNWKNSAGIEFIVKISLDKNYMFNIEKQVINHSKNDINIASYGLINRKEHMFDGINETLIHKGPLGVFNNVLSEYSFKDSKKEKKVSFSSDNSWLGFTDKYWFTAIVPDKNTKINSNFSSYLKDLEDRFQIDYSTDLTLVKAGGNFSDTAKLFTGAKQLSLLDKYSEKYQIPLFDRMVDFGWFYFITKPIFLTLTMFHKLIGNFGIAIILLTFCIKSLLFPLAYKSYVSMHKMKQYQPKITAIKERYPDDKILMNKEIMALYKREKINPAAGCLPMLIQIPIFFSLYKVLLITIEMRHAPFFGWILDLSSADPTSLFNLFGLLKFNLPETLQIGVWPLIMGLTMYLQQKVSPQPVDPIQAKVFKAYPFIFTTILYRFPAGLIIYWTVNNSFTIIQQLIINKLLDSKYIKG